MRAFACVLLIVTVLLIYCDYKTEHTEKPKEKKFGNMRFGENPK